MYQFKIKSYSFDLIDFENGKVDFKNLTPTNVEEIERTGSPMDIQSRISDIGKHNRRQIELAKKLKLATINDYKILTTN